MIVGSTQASVNALLLVTAERFIMISQPLKYDIMVTKTTMTVGIAIGWICSVMVTVLPLLGIGSKEPSRECKYDVEDVYTQQYILSLFFVSYFIPVIIMLLMYTRMAIIAHQHRNQINTLRVETTQSTQQTLEGNTVSVTQVTGEEIDQERVGGTNTSTEKNKWRAVKTIAILLGYYIVSWLCFHINILMAGFENTNKSLR